MINAYELFELKRQADEINRHRKLYGGIDINSISYISQQRDLLNDRMLHSLRDLHDPSYELSNRLKNLQTPFDDLRNSSQFINNLRLAEKSLSSAIIDNIRNLYSQTFQDLRRITEERLSPFTKTNLFSESIKDEIKLFRNRLTSPFQSSLSDTLLELEQTKRATMLSSFESLSKSVLGNINIVERDRNLFMKQVSNSLFSYDRFVENTLSKLSLGIDRNVEFALKGSLTLANEQILNSTSKIQSLVETSNLLHTDDLGLFFNRDFPRNNRYRIQKQELLSRDDIEEDEEYESLVVKSPSAISYELVTNCMTLIGLCNEASETTRGNTIFTLTTTLWLSGWKLPNVVPTNKDSFAIVVDCLYLMLYEGAGKDKLRFIEQGYINANEAELIWKIKHLRNKWLRHDISHGKESDIKKSHQHRKETLEWFGLERIPYSKDEFIFLYNSLILKVEEFLILLLERVSKFSN